jgi:hypothetical protein
MTWQFHILIFFKTAVFRVQDSAWFVLLNVSNNLVIHCILPFFHAPAILKYWLFAPPPAVCEQQKVHQNRRLLGLCGRRRGMTKFIIIY